MAQNMAKVVKMSRHLAIAHIIVGFVLICVGIADRLVEFRYYSFTGMIYLGIWVGIWMCITGCLGIPASRRERTVSRNVFNGVFMGFSITSAVIGGVVIICCSLSIEFFRWRKEYLLSRVEDPTLLDEKLENYDAEMVIIVIILVLGTVEFVIGIVTSICSCLMKPCTCCSCCETCLVHPQQAQQVLYTASPAGDVITQGPNGVPVAVPVQAGGGIVAFQSSAAQDSQPSMILLPASEAVEGQHLMVQSPPHAAMPATGFLPQEAEKPPAYA